VSTDALRILVSVILLIPATIVVMALFKRNNRLRMGASIILIIGIMLH
jgi:pilus assembly protein TadC